MTHRVLEASRRLASKYSWLSYHSLLALTAVVSCYVLSRYGLFYTAIDSARYMLSAMVQGEAAIIAIVVTLSLVAVQLVATSYHPAAVEVFKKSPDLWLLVTSYVFTMIYSLIVLKMIGNADKEAVTEAHIILACIYGFFCFVALIPYTYLMLDKLSLPSIIDELAKKIKRETLLKEDPVFPIIQIVKKSIELYDIITIRSGIGAIRDAMIGVYEAHELSDDEESRISERILMNHFCGVGLMAIDKGNQDSTIEIIDAITDVGSISVEKALNTTSRTSAEIVGLLGKHAADKSHRWTTSFSVDCLLRLGTEILDELEAMEPFVSKYYEGIVRNIAEDLRRISGIAKQRGTVFIGVKSADEKEWKEIEDMSKSISEDVIKALEELMTS